MIPDGYDARGQPVGNRQHAREVASEVLRAVAAGSLSCELVDALVLAVLDDPLVATALALREAEGRHVARRAVELAALVLEEVEADEETDGAVSS
jgi:hypothetical protein